MDSYCQQKTQRSSVTVSRLTNVSKEGKIKVCQQEQRPSDYVQALAGPISTAYSNRSIAISVYRVIPPDGAQQALWLQFRSPLKLENRCLATNLGDKD